MNGYEMGVAESLGEMSEILAGLGLPDLLFLVIVDGVLGSLGRGDHERSDL